MWMIVLVLDLVLGLGEYCCKVLVIYFGLIVCFKEVIVDEIIVVFGIGVVMVMVVYDVL